MRFDSNVIYYKLITIILDKSIHGLSKNTL